MFSLPSLLMSQTYDGFRSVRHSLQFNQDLLTQKLEFNQVNDYLSVALKWEDIKSNFSYRITTSDGKIGEWTLIENDVHIVEENSNQVGNALVILGKGIRVIEIKLLREKADLPINLSIEVTHDNINGLNDNRDDITNRNACTCEELPYFNREEWGCPWGDESPNFIPSYSEISHMVIHHQAGNAPEPYDAVVRAIWNYHVNTNGWDDIGYNWLIAPNGAVYKGRAWLNGDQNVRGAHTCACNSNKMGICLLGNFTTELPPIEQYDALKDFMVWKACELSIRPDKEDEVSRRLEGVCTIAALSNISGHKDVCGASYTECPGNSFYSMIPQLKLETIEQYLSCADTLNTAVSEDFVNDIKITQNSAGIKVVLSDSYEIAQVRLIDLNGQILYESNSYFGNIIPTNNLLSNVYIVSVKADGRFYNKKVLILNE